MYIISSLENLTLVCVKPDVTASVYVTFEHCLN